MGIDVFGVFQKREHGRWVSFQRYYYGHRDELRKWLGWNEGGHYQIKPIVQPRGLPADLDLEAKTVACGWNESWLLADEILNALPALATSFEKIRIAAYFEACSKEPSLREWEAAIEEFFMKECLDLRKNANIFDEAEWQDFKNSYASSHRRQIRLVAASPKPFDVAFTNEYGFVECIYDFSDYFQDFTDEIRCLKDKYGNVRFVFGFN